MAKYMVIHEFILLCNKVRKPKNEWVRERKIICNIIIIQHEHFRNAKRFILTETLRPTYDGANATKFYSTESYYKNILYG